MANIVAFQGIEGAHSDVACRIKYPDATTLACQSFEDAFEAVETGKADVCLIPIENSHAGRVAEIHNIIPHTPLHIVGEYLHPVKHHLLGIKGSKIEDIKYIYSHQQALMQCKNNCRSLNAESRPFFDTAAAAREIASQQDSSKAALASELCADLYGLEILQRDMQDSNDNTTSFMAFGKEPTYPNNNENDSAILSTMLFTTRNISASLYKALGGFATNNINIIKLESYISSSSFSKKNGEAQFLITFEGSTEDSKVQAALDEFGFFTKNARLLGTYLADKKRYL